MQGVAGPHRMCSTSNDTACCYCNGGHSCVATPNVLAMGSLGVLGSQKTLHIQLTNMTILQASRGTSTVSPLKHINTAPGRTHGAQG